MNDRTVLLVASGTWAAGLMPTYERALASFGLRVVRFDLGAARDALVPLGPLVRRAMNHLDFHALNTRANRALVMEALRARPLAIIIGVTEPVKPATLLQLKVSLPDAPIVGIYPDMPIRIPDAAFPGMPLYDLFCVHTKSSIPLLQSMGCRRAFYLPCAADPELHHPEELTADERREFGCDLVFVGNWRPEHEELFGVLEGYDLAIWGSTNWRRYGRPGWVKSRWRGRPLNTGAEYSKAHHAAKVCLNPIDPLDLPAHNQRVFELPACGVFSLVTRTAEVTELFDEGESVACFDGPAELLEKVRHYLDRPDDRRRIAGAAYRRVVEGGQTYRDRVRTIFGEIGLSRALG